MELLRSMQKQHGEGKWVYEAKLERANISHGTMCIFYRRGDFAPGMFSPVWKCRANSAADAYSRTALRNVLRNQIRCDLWVHVTGAFLFADRNAGAISGGDYHDCGIMRVWSRIRHF